MLVRHLATVLVGGATMIFTFAPFGLWWLQPFLLAGLFVLWCGATPGRAALLGFTFGIGWFCAGVSWVYISMHDVGGMPMAIAGLATVLFAIVLAAYTALAGWMVAKLGAPLVARSSTAATTITLVQALLVLPASFTLCEWLRGWVFTGFPWIAPGYAHTDGPLAGFAPLVGVHGVNYLAVVMGALVASMVASSMVASMVASMLASMAASKSYHILNHVDPASTHKALVGDAPRTQLPETAPKARGGGNLRQLAPPTSVLLALCIIGLVLRDIEWTQPVGKPLSVSLLQGNVPQELKFVEGRFESTLATYERLATRHASTLIVLPETALPRMLHTIPPATLQRFDTLASQRGATLITGVPRAQASARYFNSAISLGREAQQTYDKYHLVPFGEFIPLGFQWFVDLMRMPLGNFTAGGTAQTPMRVADQQIAVNICYEDLFGEEIIRQLPQATLLLNISNVGWFGNSLAPHQHLQASRMRALETRRVMLRATNTGATAVISAQGQVTDSLPFFTEGALAATVQGRSGATPYLLTGNWLVITFCALALAWHGWRGRRKPHLPADQRL